MYNCANRFLLTAFIAGSIGCTTPVWGQVINEDMMLLANDGAAGDWFGASIAISNGVVAIGANQDGDNGDLSGSAYLFESSTGDFIAKLLPTDGAASDWFGRALDIDAGIVVVGSIGDRDNGFSSGSAYLFNASTGAQLHKLLPDDGAAFDLFGQAVAINNGIVAIGAYGDDDNGSFSGSVYLFDASTGKQTAKLLPSDGVASDMFGWSIAMDNGIVAIGAKVSVGGLNPGSAYLFDASTGAQLFKIFSDDGATGDHFGYSIDIDNGIVVVGAWDDDDNGLNSGSAYLFDAASGVQTAKLLPKDGAPEDQFGISVGISNGTVAVGSHWDDDNGDYSGSAYLFDAASGVQTAKLLPSNGNSFDFFGWSVAIESGVIGVGAFEDDDSGVNSGSAYLFSINNCPADFTGNGTLNFFDVSAFLKLFAANDPAGDFNNDERWNFFDVSAFLTAFAAGCP